MNGSLANRGEQLDIVSVDQWLKAQDSSIVGEPKVTQYLGGASNWTYRLKYPTRDLVLRRPPAGTKAGSAHDMVREYTVQAKLKAEFSLVPAMVALCQDQAVIGCDFYVMKRIDGVIPRSNLPQDISLDARRTRELCINMLDQMIALHRVDYKAAGLAELAKGPGYARRQVEGWDRRYTQAKTWNSPSFNRVREWLLTNVPEDAGACLIHNDWRFDNIVLDPQHPTELVGVLDWELATVGDPLMELGCMLAYWIEPSDGMMLRATRRQPTHLPGMFTRNEVVNYYLKRTGFSVDMWSFYEVFGLFRLAAIAQQIYYRYHHRQSKNKAFRHYWLFVNMLDRRCRSLIRKARR